VTVSCLVCTITTFLILINASDNLNVNHNVYPTTRSGDALHHLGYIPVGLTETARCLLLTATLFLGPLFEASVVEGRWRGWIRLHGLDVLCGWTGWRNIVAVRTTRPSH
jgi:prenyl protein peptidase